MSAKLDILPIFGQFRSFIIGSVFSRGKGGDTG